jgi:hypothetical protein
VRHIDESDKSSAVNITLKQQKSVRTEKSFNDEKNQIPATDLSMVSRHSKASSPVKNDMSMVSRRSKASSPVKKCHQFPLQNQAFAGTTMFPQNLSTVILQQDTMPNEQSLEGPHSQILASNTDKDQIKELSYSVETL